MAGTNREDLRKVAMLIARRLFTNGAREHAQRLVLTVDTPESRDLGGWSETAAIDQIVGVLEREGVIPLAASRDSQKDAR